MISKQKWIGMAFILIPIVSWIFISGAKMQYKATPYEEMAKQITTETAKKIYSKYKIDPIGSGGSMMDDVKVLALSFNCYDILSIESSRELVVNCVEQYLVTVNNNKEIRPYLHNYPFTEQNIDLTIFFYQGADFKDAIPGQVSCASALNGKIFYHTKDPEDEYKLETLHQETYEEALRIVKEQGRLNP